MPRHTSPDPRRRRQFPTEGFTLHLDASGLEIRVDDFHPLPLKLSWELIEPLRREAQAPRGSDGSQAAGDDLQAGGHGRSGVARHPCSGCTTLTAVAVRTK